MKIIVLGQPFNRVLIYFFYLIAVSFLISLGVWQLGRAEEKKALLLAQALSADKEIIKIESMLESNIENLRYRKIKISGYYDNAHQFLIDNQIVNGQVGYFVMTPLLLEHSSKAILVNRGWLPLNKNRKILPELLITTKKTTVTGTINRFPSVGMILAGAEIPTEGWPSVVHLVDTNILAKKLAYALLPFQIELDNNRQEGYVREWKKSSGITAEKHIAYAVQWFALAFTLTVLLIVFSRQVNAKTAKKK